MSDTPSASTLPPSPSDGSAPLRVLTPHDGVRTLLLDRPDRLNAVNAPLAEALPAALAEAAADDRVRAVVITGAGRGFCAGLDLTEPVSLAQGSRAERLDPLRWVGRWVHALVACEKPVIAAVNGVAAGAGFGLALACDVRVMARGARLTAGYVRRGLSPDAGVTWFLPRLVGHARATELLMSGREVAADEAERLGLTTQVVEDDAVRTTAEALAAQYAAGPPIALALTKRLLAQSAEATLDAQLRSELTHIVTCFQSADAREAMLAFREKRAPVFRGR